MRESRLARRTITQSKRQLYIYLGAIIVILFLALNFGPFLIASSGSFIDKLTGKKAEQEAVVSDADLLPPSLDPLPEATSDKTINVSGQANYPEGKVELYVNGDRAGNIVKIKDQSFEFKDISLSPGSNFVKARIIIGDKKSDFSDDEIVLYSKDKPKLEVSSPSDGKEFKGPDKLITVRGTTDPQNSVRVNGFVAIVDSQGNFSYDLSLNGGENKLTVEAEDLAGQTEKVELTVSYSE